MTLEFDAVEIRIVGVLIEKQITTPDYYPMTLNALLIGCNQKSNRSPVLDLQEGELASALAKLQLKKLVRKMLLEGSRVSKYYHLFDDVYRPGIQEKVILCELFLRGPQTVGELRTRTERMYPISSLEDVEKTLDALAARPEGPFVIQLPRQPGQKECRYTHLFCGKPDPEQLTATQAKTKTVTAPSDGITNSSRLTALEEQVAALTTELRALQQRVEQLDKTDR